MTGGSEGRGAIQALLKLVQAGGGRKEACAGGAADEAGDADGENAAGGTHGKKRRKGGQPLCRPLIAICNDLYAPALRPLRAIAKIVHYKKPTARSLTPATSAFLLCITHIAMRLQKCCIRLHADGADACLLRLSACPRACASSAHQRDCPWIARCASSALPPKLADLT